ncbi:MAG: hypothetical protein EOO43_22930 [Flavobacterium sp.]|nr:MAG: hypothetical protein EOO43_22930 [Flavobacterium sp.]
MEISENKVRSIVEDIVSRVVAQQGLDNKSSSMSKPNPPREIGVFDDLDEAIAAAKTAYNEFRSYSLKDKERIIENIRMLKYLPKWPFKKHLLDVMKIK